MRPEPTPPAVRTAIAAVLAVGLIGAPAAAASTWCDPDVDPACWDDGSTEGGWVDDGYSDGSEDPYATTWYDDGYPDDGWVDGSGDPYATTWYEDGGVGAGDATTGGTGLPPALPALLAMVDRSELAGQGAEPFDPGELGVDEAAQLGAARLVLGVDALAELGAFRRDPDPGVNEAVRQVRERIPSGGLDEAGYRAEISALADDIGELLDVLDAAGSLGDPLIQVEEALDDPATLDRLAAGATGLYDPNDWLSAAADLARRQGAEPLVDEERDGDLAAILALADRLAGPASSTAAGGTDEATTPSSSTSTSVAEPLPAIEEAGADPAGSGDGPGIGWLVAVGLALAAIAAAGLGWLRAARRRPTDDPPPAGAVGSAGSNGRAGSSGSANGPTPAAQASLEDLLEVSRRMTSSLDVVEVAEIALAEAERLVGGEGGLLAVRSDDGLRALCHRPATLFDLESLERGALRRVLDTGRSIVQVTDDEPCLVEVPMALAAIPIVAEGTVAGAILVVRVPTEPFARQELDGLEMLAPLIGSAILAAQAHGSATELADIDPLSGLNNRRRLSADLAIGADRPLGTIMIDIDHFKHFNDTNGHAAGDEALRRVGQLLSASVRPGDVVYRYGGEEFCVLLPDATPDEAASVAERVRAAVEAADIPGGENQPAGRVTISVGVARGQPGDHHGVIEAADGALYRAKHGGRNRVCTDWS